MIDKRFEKIEGCMELIKDAQEVINIIPDADETFLQPVIDLIGNMAKAINKTAIDHTYECQHCGGEIPHGCSSDCIAYDCFKYVKAKDNKY